MPKTTNRKRTGTAVVEAAPAKPSDETVNALACVYDRLASIEAKLDLIARHSHYDNHQLVAGWDDIELAEGRAVKRRTFGWRRVLSAKKAISKPNGKTPKTASAKS